MKPEYKFRYDDLGKESLQRNYFTHIRVRTKHYY